MWFFFFLFPLPSYIPSCHWLKFRIVSGKRIGFAHTLKLFVLSEIFDCRGNFFFLLVLWTVSTVKNRLLYSRFDCQTLKVWMRELETKHWIPVCFQLFCPGALPAAREQRLPSSSYIGNWSTAPSWGQSSAVLPAPRRLLLWDEMDRMALQFVPISQKHRISMNLFAQTAWIWSWLLMF